MTGQFRLGAEHLVAWRRLYASPESVRRYQERALQRLMRRAIAYYSRVLQNAGLRPNDINTLESLRRVPITTKTSLQAAPLEDRFNLDVPRERCSIHETSGSSGQPMVIARTPQENMRLWGRRLRTQMLGGVRPHLRRVILGVPPRQNIAHRLGMFPVSGIPLTTDLKSMVAELERRRPDILKGPPGTLDLLAGLYPERLKALRLRRIFTGSEQLPQRTRERIEQGFGCRAADLYGAVEFNLIAWECLQCGHYHTCDDSVIVEVMNGGRPALPGEDGEIVVTALHSYAMPFLRYKIGDVVRLPAKRRACKIGFGSIEQIQGRVVDYLHFEGTPLMSPYVLINQLDVIPGLRRYHVEQTSPLTVIVRCELVHPEMERDVIRDVTVRSREVIPTAVGLKIEIAENIAYDPERKRRSVIRSFAS